MKRVLKGIEPPLLTQYRSNTPANTWEKFKQSSSRRQQLKKLITEHQGGLCAYCEIDLKDADAHGNADFRVEHFHPKSDTSTGHNWHLDWNNLLGCCHGGSNSKVVDAHKRFTSPNLSCDVPKAHKDLTGTILNPLELPAFPAIFKCDRVSGELSVITNNCATAGIPEIQAEQTLTELCLNAERLTDFRKAVLQKLNEEIAQRVNSGMGIDQARRTLAAQQLRKNSKGHWPPFFSSIRSYLGADAEQHLQSINYNG